MSPALGFAYLSLAATSIRIANHYHQSAQRTDSPRWRDDDTAEWRRLKVQARRSIAASSICDRPRLP